MEIPRERTTSPHHIRHCDCIHHAIIGGWVVMGGCRAVTGRFKHACTLSTQDTGTSAQQGPSEECQTRHQGRVATSQPRGERDHQGTQALS